MAWKCDICGRKYDSKKEAENCEKNCLKEDKNKLKENKKYRCDFCRKVYSTKKEAEECEEKCSEKQDVEPVEEKEVLEEENQEEESSDELASEKMLEILSKYEEFSNKDQAIAQQIQELDIEDKTPFINLAKRRLKLLLQTENFLKKEIKNLNKKIEIDAVKPQLKIIEEQISLTKRNIKSVGESSHHVTLKCPYCHKQTVIPIEEGASEPECENCGKKFKLLTGKVKKTRGRLTAVVQYGAEPISITIGVKKSEKTINFRTNYRLLISRGDKISFIWKKGWLSSGYAEKPTQICNWDTEEILKI